MEIALAVDGPRTFLGLPELAEGSILGRDEERIRAHSVGEHSTVALSGREVNPPVRLVMRATVAKEDSSIDTI